METGDNAVVGKFVYICGKSCSTTITECFSLKGKLVADLSLSCFVRTHACPVTDLVDAYCAIASSSAFIFILNGQTLYDPECLNQLGVAILYNVPVIAVRVENFELPKPLPLRFYETRFVDKRANAPSSKKESSQSEIPLTLAGVILSCYEHSIVCKATSYVSFLREVARALSSVTLDANGNNLSDMHISEEDGKIEGKSAAQIRLARAGLGSSRSSKRSQRNGISTSSAYKQKGLQNIYGSDQKLLNRQPIVNRFAYKKIDLNLSGIPSSLNRNGKKPQKVNGRQAFQREHTFGSVRGKENRSALDQTSPRGPGVQSVEHKEHRTAPTILESHLADISKGSSGSEQNLATSLNKSDNELAVPVIGPKGQKLRRYSSLPVVPTQYLVASDKKSGSPQIMSFPPPSSSYSPRSESPFFLSGDELDIDPLHLSRACTPVETLESTSRSDSTEESSR